MSRRWVFAAGLVAVVVVVLALFRAPEPIKAADETNFQAKAAVKVVMKNQVFEYLDRPRVEWLAGRTFIVGSRVNASATVWLPAEDVSFIEEYTSLEEMRKVYPGLEPKKN